MSTETLDEALVEVRLALLDSSVLIAALTSADATHRLAAHLLGRLESENDVLHGVISTTSIAEVLVYPLRASPERAAEARFLLTEFPNLQVISVDINIAYRAAELRARSGLRTADALVLATGLIQGADAVVTNDHSWIRQAKDVVGSMRLVLLDDHI